MSKTEKGASIKFGSFDLDAMKNDNKKLSIIRTAENQNKSRSEDWLVNHNDFTIGSLPTHSWNTGQLA